MWLRCAEPRRISAAGAPRARRARVLVPHVLADNGEGGEKLIAQAEAAGEHDANGSQRGMVVGLVLFVARTDLRSLEWRMLRARAHYSGRSQRIRRYVVFLRFRAHTCSDET